MNEDVKALKDALKVALKNLNTQKSTSRRILSGFCQKNAESYELKQEPFLSQKLSSKLFSA